MIHGIGISLTATTFDLSKPLAAMAERAKQDGFEFYYTRHIAEDVFELELRRDTSASKPKCPLNTYKSTSRTVA